MASTHKHIRSGTANKRPTTAIADGQIALNTNTTSPGLFFKDSTGASIIKIGPVHVGTTAPNVSPAVGGSTGNSTGEAWLDTSLTPNGWKVWTGATWVNATPAGSDTIQGLLELATNAETQAGSDTARAVTPAGLQSKMSDSTSTTSSTTIASSTAVKSAYDLANAALPKSGGTVTGNLEIGISGSLTFEGATADAFETTIAVVDPTADRTITLPNATGTVVLDNNGQTVQFGLGAVATPSITFTGDTNTGIYSPGADQVAISTNGTGRVFVDANGDMGVGTTPTNVATYKRIDIGVAGTSNGLLTLRSAGGAQEANIGCSSAGLSFTTNSYATPFDARANEIIFGTGASGTERMRITSAGLVGLGTSSPSSLLELGGATNGSTLTFSCTSVNPGTERLLASLNYKTGGYGPVQMMQAYSVASLGDNASTLRFYTDSGTSTQQERLRIDQAGRVGIGTSSPQQDFHINDATGAARIRFSGGAANTDTFEIGQSIIGVANSGFSIYDVEATASRLVIDTSGNVGIGTTGPDGNLTIGGLTNTGGQSVDAINVNRTDGLRLFGVKWDVTSNEVRFSGNTKNYVFRNGSSEAETARIDSSGRLLVGTSSATGDQLLVVQGYAGVSAGNAEFGLRRGGNPSAADQGLGAISFQNNSGNTGARIEAISAGSWTSGSNHRCYLTFSTTADGASSPTERMRIHANGFITYGTGSVDSTGLTFGPTRSGAGSAPTLTWNGSFTGTVTACDFLYNGARQGSITTTTSATAYNTSSDYRLKENIEPLTGASSRLSQLQVHRFNFIADPDHTVDGFIAHEAQAVVPECVTGEKNAVDADGNPVYQGIDQSKLVPLLTAALQEAIGRIESLEAEVAQLKGA